MGLADRDYMRNYSLGEKGNSLTKLLIINLTFYITLALCRTYYYFIYEDTSQIGIVFKEDILSWFTLPKSPMGLLKRPWTFITMLFAEYNFWNTLGNMLWFWSFGYIFQDLTGNKKLIPLFVYGGWGAGIVFWIAAALLNQPIDYFFSGTSAAVTAVVIGTTCLAPKYKIYSIIPTGFPIWILTILFIVTSFATTTWHAMVNYIPVLTGSAIGFSYVYLLKKGIDTGKWMSNLLDKMGNLFNPGK
jgi:membrane associated rhomboid family serine protease